MNQQQQVCKGKENPHKIFKYRGEDAWSVESETVAGKRYTVTLRGCDCKDYKYRHGRLCKHMHWLVEYLARDPIEAARIVAKYSLEPEFTP
jgi:hypothetical protein